VQPRDLTRASLQLTVYHIGNREKPPRKLCEEVVVRDVLNALHIVDGGALLLAASRGRRGASGPDRSARRR